VKNVWIVSQGTIAEGGEPFAAYARRPSDKEVTALRAAPSLSRSGGWKKAGTGFWTSGSDYLERIRLKVRP
jgi:hypothetical protein